ncbi:MAG: hypothetical protein N2749_00695 [Clostridia bacterium]|nr:hypothetical protein [Clostridia bacterium]
MLEKITITGIYTGSEERGIMVGGKIFLPHHVLAADVDENTFFVLREGEKNGWFKINQDNYNEFLKSRGREVNVDKYEENNIKTEVKELDNNTDEMSNNDDEKDEQKEVKSSKKSRSKKTEKENDID